MDLCRSRLIAIAATAAYNFVFEQINGIRITRADFILRKDSLYAVKCVFIYKSRKYIVVNTVVIACYSYIFFVVKNFEYSIFNESFSVISNTLFGEFIDDFTHDFSRIIFFENETYNVGSLFVNAHASVFIKITVRRSSAAAEAFLSAFM